MDIIKALNFIRQEANQEYQDRIPVATQYNIDEIGNPILEYAPLKNQFLDILVNKIGLTMISSGEYTNLFEQFKGQMIEYGDTIEDIYVELPVGYTFDKDAEDPFTITKGNLQVVYHTIDRENQYSVTIHDDLLRRAFKSASGLTTLVNNLIQSLWEGMTQDEFAYAKHLLSTDAIFGHTVDIEATTQAELAANLLAQIKLVSSNMKFKRQDYNALETDALTPLSEQVLVIRNDIKQAIDMQVLTGLFNLSKAELETRIIEVDSFDEVNQLAALIDKRGLRMHDALKSSESIRNPKGLYTNYFVNHWGLVSYSTYRNAVKFTSDFSPSDNFVLKFSSIAFGNTTILDFPVMETGLVYYGFVDESWNYTFQKNTTEKTIIISGDAFLPSAELTIPFELTLTGVSHTPIPDIPNDYDEGINFVNLRIEIIE